MNNDILELFALFKSNGYTLFLVGGAVRDMLNNSIPSDYDFTTNAHPTVVKQILAEFTIDDRKELFGTLYIKYKEYHIEITTMRKDIGIIEYRSPKSVVFIDNVKEDLLRRDYTIDAILYSDGYIDYYNGITDLNNKILRVIGNVNERIKEDPIRILRGLRLMLKYDLLVHCISYLDIFNKYSEIIDKINSIKYIELFKLLKLNNQVKFIKMYNNIYSRAFPSINFSFLKEDNISYINILKLLPFITSDDIILEILSSNILIKEDRKLLLKYKDIKNDFKILERSNCLYNDILLYLSKNNLDDIINLITLLDLNLTIKTYSKITSLIKDILKSNVVLKIKDMVIKYNDLEFLNISKEEKSVIYHKLFNIVLFDNSKNNKEVLLSIASKLKNLD